MRPSERVRQDSIERVNRHYEAETGKRDLLRTWDEIRDGKIKNPKGIDVSAEHDYLVALGKRIRKEYVLVTHNRFAPANGERKRAEEI
jgi:hypothetical protein